MIPDYGFHIPGTKGVFTFEQINGMKRKPKMVKVIDTRDPSRPQGGKKVLGTMPWPAAMAKFA